MDHTSERDFTEELSNEADAHRENVYELAAVAGERMHGGWRIVDLGSTWAAVHIRRGVIEHQPTRGAACDAAHYHGNRDARVSRGGCVADAFRV